MNFITKNLKQAGVFNTLLIVVGIVYDIARLFNQNNTYNVILIVLLQLIAYSFALSYAFKGYKKNAAKSFKLFVYAFGLSLLATIIRTIVSNDAPVIATVNSIIGFIPVAILAFVKDLGKKRSLSLAGVSLASGVFGIVYVALTAPEFARTLLTTLSGLILSAVLFIFVIAKYRDKEARGAK